MDPRRKGKHMQEIRNFVELQDGIGTAGQPTREQFDLVARAGYRHVINIGMPDHPDSLAGEGDLVTSLGMTYVHIPVPFEAPRPEHVRLFCDMLSAVRGEPVFVHCLMNHRVTAFMYHYFTKVAGYGEEDARSPMFDQWEPNEIWKDVLSWSREKIGI